MPGDFYGGYAPGDGPGRKNPRPKPKKNQDGSVYDPASGSTYKLPPFMAYDPSIEAEIRANQRGLQDMERDFDIQRKIDRQDYRQNKKDITRSFTRGTQDIKRDAQRTRRGFKEKRQDIRTSARRGAEDFRIKFNDMLRKYGIQATNQAQVANARGVGGGGTLAAAAQKRAENMSRDAAALQLARSRQKEDVATALMRIGKDQGEFRRDVSRSRTRLRQDTGRERKLAGRDFRRTRRSARQEIKRARREAAISEIDLTRQAIYNARQTNPGSFNKYGYKGANSNKGKNTRKKKGGKKNG